MCRSLLSIAVLAAGLAGCGEREQHAATPGPAALTRDAIGYYCNMIVADHLGPKGQIHLDGRDEPVWFASVRDTIAFMLLPEEPKSVAAIYVNDMGRATWDRPEPGTWVEAHDAWFVVGSDRTGGMGAPEVVPFALEEQAQTFARRHGGRTLRLGDIPEDAVLGAPPVAVAGAGSSHAMPGAHDTPGAMAATGAGHTMPAAGGHSGTHTASADGQQVHTAPNASGSAAATHGAHR